MNSEKKVVQVYLQSCESNPQPAGFGDFLRGFIALYNYAKQYGYKAYMDKQHPLFLYFKSHPYLIINTIAPVHDLITGPKGKKYHEIDTALQGLFQSDQSFAVFTNAMYSKKNNILENYGKLTEDCKQFLRSMLVPIDTLQSSIQSTLQTLSIIRSVHSKEGFSVIHLRFGDEYLNRSKYDESVMYTTSRKIQTLLSKETHTQFLLLSDSSLMANKLKELHPSLVYLDNKKIHLGGLQNKMEGIESTLIDFFLLSKTNSIYYLYHSGFSRIISEIFEKPYIEL